MRETPTPAQLPIGHYDTVTRAILAGRVVPFLGAGANLCGRKTIPSGGAWKPGTLLPSGTELSAYLAATFEYPEPDPMDLIRVAQFVDVMNGSGPLYEELHELFDVDYEPTALHLFLASLPQTLRAKGSLRPYPLVVTTNYDDALERAFQSVDEPFDLVWYMADGEHRGKFLHRPPGGSPIAIETPNEYRALALDERTVILKIHGAVDRPGAEWDSFVITEDHYIDYLTRTDLSSLIPVRLAAKLKRSHLLFLGYGLRDWNLRVILHRIWGEQRLSYKPWAVQLHPSPVEQEFWRKRDVDILDVPLDEYVEALSKRVQVHAGPGG